MVKSQWNFCTIRYHADTTVLIPQVTISITATARISVVNFSPGTLSKRSRSVLISRCRVFGSSFSSFFALSNISALKVHTYSLSPDIFCRQVCRSLPLWNRRFPLSNWPINFSELAKCRRPPKVKDLSVDYVTASKPTKWTAMWNNVAFLKSDATRKNNFKMICQI